MPDRLDDTPRRFAGRYELIQRLAVGGMAEVFLARRCGPGGGAPLVVKRILPQLAARDEFVEMFLAEASIAGMLRHDHIVRTYEFGMAESGYFIAMELLEGMTLRKLAEAFTRRGTHVPRAAAIAVVRAMCAGLHYAHERCDADGKPLGIVHRDVSPQNVIVTRAGCTKLLDFGIAKSTVQHVETRQGTLKGRLRYMSPEQTRGHADRRSDLFSAGLILYELCLGRAVYRGATDEELYAQVIAARYEPPHAIDPDFPPSLESVIATALARRPEDRYPTAAAFAEDLERAERVIGERATSTDLADLVADEEANQSLVQQLIESEGSLSAVVIELDEDSTTDVESRLG